MTYSSIYIYLNKGADVFTINYDPYLSIFIVCRYQEYAIFFIIAAPPIHRKDAIFDILFDSNSQKPLSVGNDVIRIPVHYRAVIE